MDPRQPDHPVIFANDAFSRLTGYSHNEIIGMRFGILQGPDTDPRAIAAIDAALDRGEGIETEVLHYRKDGSTFWNFLVLSPVRDEAGTILSFSVAQIDVSDRKQAESRLRDAQERLEAEDRTRTGILQATIDQKTALLHEVEHRVKNNLQVISSLVLLNARRIRDGGTQQALYNLSERISALSTVHRLLYSAGDVSRFDLRSFVTELSTDLMETLPRGQVELAIRVDPTLMPAAKAAPFSLLLNEIVGNAAKHAFPERRKGRVSIGITRDEQNLHILVADDGVGFDRALLERGFGKLLIDMLVRQLRGTVAWTDAGPGTHVDVVLPIDAEEMRL
jgi:PAS domain S-box-containing protein